MTLDELGERAMRVVMTFCAIGTVFLCGMAWQASLLADRDYSRERILRLERPAQT